MFKYAHFKNIKDEKAIYQFTQNDISCFKSFKFYEKCFKTDPQKETVRNITKKLAFENKEISLVLIKALHDIETDKEDRYKVSMLPLYKELILIEDSLQDFRI